MSSSSSEIEIGSGATEVGLGLKSEGGEDTGG